MKLKNKLTLLISATVIFNLLGVTRVLAWNSYPGIDFWSPETQQYIHDRDVARNLRQVPYFYRYKSQYDNYNKNVFSCDCIEDKKEKKKCKKNKEAFANRCSWVGGPASYYDRGYNYGYEY